LGGVATRVRLLSSGIVLTFLAGCIPATPPKPATRGPDQAHAMIDAALPLTVPDRNGWVADLYSVFGALGIAPTHEHFCAVIAVAEQESGLRVDPVIPGLGQIAWREIDQRAARAAIPSAVVHEVLKLKSPNGLSYATRIDAARTEKQLSDIFEDFTGSVPLGRTLFASWNPIHTRGPMQVNVAFAQKFSATRPYPYPLKGSLDDELFTRRGSLYFGTAHLLAYSAPYDRYLYRFADYNAGQFSSRNAAFQQALSVAAGAAVVPDGALLVPHAPISQPSDTELVARKLTSRLGLDTAQIHAALAQDRDASFQDTELYRRVFELAAQTRERSLPKASVPHINLQGPKLHTHLTTEWYAQRVQGRFERCLAH
jgi:Protein of unknown function (DUF1615)